MSHISLSYTVSQTAETVFEYLFDADKFAAVHPVILRMDKLGENKYLVHERLKFAGIPVTFKYPVSVSGDRSRGNVIMHATIMKLTHVEINFAISETNGRSHVREEITIRSILPIHGTMRRVFKTQHAILFEHIDQIQ